MKRYLAATPATAGIAFGTAIHTASSAARGLVDNINSITRCIIDGKGWDAKVAILFDAAKLVTT